MLLALSAISAAGYAVSAFDLMPYLIYQFTLLVVVLVYIFLSTKNEKTES